MEWTTKMTYDTTKMTDDTKTGIGGIRDPELFLLSNLVS